MGPSRPATLALEDGTVLSGIPFGAQATNFGELVFTTEMTGYQESLTDPSYDGQLLISLLPHASLQDGHEFSRQFSSFVHPDILGQGISPLRPPISPSLVTP